MSTLGATRRFPGSLPCWLQYEANERADLLAFEPVKRRTKSADKPVAEVPLSALAQYFQALSSQKQQQFLGAVTQSGIEPVVLELDMALPASGNIPFSRLDCYRNWFLNQEGCADLFEHLRQQMIPPALAQAC